MSKIKNGGLDQYGAEPFEWQQFGTAGVEGVKRVILCYCETGRLYCKTLNVSLLFISRAKQNCKIKGPEYQLQAKIGRTYYRISNCMVLIRQNKRRQKNSAC